VPNTPPALAADWPPADVLLEAWRRLVEDPDSAAEFAALVFPPFMSALAERHHHAHPDEIATAAGEAVLAFLKRPSAYDPQRLPLTNYLLFIAKRRLQNQWTAERRHHAGRIPWDSVELDVAGRNDEGVEPSGFDAAALAPVVARMTDGERRVFELMRGGERRTEAFADALGVAGDPDAAAHVKRAKDRMLARLKRAAGGDDA